MNKKKTKATRVVLSIVLCRAAAHAEFKSDIKYFLSFGQKSSWGVRFPDNTIKNNGGSAGTLEGENSACLLCPSMPYGVTHWVAPKDSTYACTDTEKEKAANQQQQQLKAATTCPATAKQAESTLDYAAYFKNVKTLFGDSEKSLENVIESFPDFTKGQGYESADYLSFCSAATNEINISQQLATAQAGARSIIADISSYFPEQQFVVALDMTMLVASKGEQEKAAAATSSLRQRSKANQ